MRERDDIGSSYSLTQRSVVARRQLHASIGAVVAIALIAIAAVLTVRVSSTPGQVVASDPSHRPVKAVVREVPSQRMQAKDQTKTDQAKTDRGS